MILKKPYAFFIKNFKIFHLIIFALAVVLLYKTSLIYDFLKVYNQTSPNVIGKELTNTLFAPWLYILIGIIIVINVIIIVVLIKKDKPYMYYIFNISLYVAVLLIYIAANSVIGSLEKYLVATKITLAIRDITNIARLLQTVSVVFYFIRSTGFDIKKFDFVRDLQGLDISEEDSEEIEVAVEFEKNVMIRNIKKNLRNVNYYYKENKFIINIGALSFFAVILILIYLGTNKYDKVYKENEFVNAYNISIGVKESTVITKDYNGNVITDDDKALVAVKVSIKSDKEFETSRAALVVNKMQYYPVKMDASKVYDLGNLYKNEIPTEFTDYLLIYQIPKIVSHARMTFKYVDNVKAQRGTTKIDSINIKLSPKYPEDKEPIVSEHALNTDVTILNSKINISNYEIKDKFENGFKSCIGQECFDLKEVLIPTLSESDKAVMKIEGTYEGGSLYKLIDKYVTIEYTKDSITYKETGDLKEVVASKTKQDNVIYIEVNKDLINAQDIKLSFNLRNNIYKYVLRGEINE